MLCASISSGVRTVSVQKYTADVAEVMAAVKQHCMCATFEDLGGAYRVLYPCGFRLDGVQATYQMVGKKVALERMLNAMERHWNEQP